MIERVKGTDSFDPGTIGEKMNEIIDMVNSFDQFSDIKKRFEQDEKIIAKLIGQMATHHHGTDGKPGINLECLLS